MYIRARACVCVYRRERKGKNSVRCMRVRGEHDRVTRTRDPGLHAIPEAYAMASNLVSERHTTWIIAVESQSKTATVFTCNSKIRVRATAVVEGGFFRGK